MSSTPIRGTFWLDATSSRPAQVMKLDEACQGDRRCDMLTVATKYADRTSAAQFTTSHSPVSRRTHMTKSKLLVTVGLFAVFALAAFFLPPSGVLAQDAKNKVALETESVAGPGFP